MYLNQKKNPDNNLQPELLQWREVTFEVWPSKSERREPLDTDQTRIEGSPLFANKVPPLVTDVIESFDSPLSKSKLLYRDLIWMNEKKLNKKKMNW